MRYLRGLVGKFIFPYILMLLFGIWTYRTIQRISNLEALRFELLNFKTTVNEPRYLEKAFFAEEFNSDSFLSSGKSNFLKATTEILDQVETQLSDFEEAEILSKTWIDSVRLQTTIYRESFDLLVKEMNKKGFKDFGLEGEMRAVIHEVENSPLKFDRAFVLMLRRHEKDFLMRKNLQYLEKFDKSKKEFINHVNSLGIAKTKKSELLGSITSYGRLFRELVATQQRIGLSESDGLRAQLSHSLSIIADLVEARIKESSSTIDRQILINKMILALLFILIIGIGIFILNRHIITITKSIKSISEASDDLALGKLPERLDVVSSDELGQAQEALNRLVEGQASKLTFAKDIGDGKLDGKIDLLSEEDILGQSLIKMAENLSYLILETKRVLQLANEEGKLEVAIENKYQSGSWADFTSSFNELFNTFQKPLNEINVLLDCIANGDLSVRSSNKAKGDVKVLMNNLNHTLLLLSQFIQKNVDHSHLMENTSSEMEVSSQEMTSSTDEIAGAISQMAQGASQQVRKVEDIWTLIESISSAAVTMELIAEEVRRESSNGVQNCQKGEELIETMSHEMDEITIQSKRVQDSISALAKRSKEIGEILSVIENIASQTNLLSLNAAIEAVQAGDAGRGFSVIATNIRELSEDAKSSIEDIANIITAIRTDIKATAGSLEDMFERVTSGKTTTLTAKESFAEILQSTNATFGLASKIHESSSYQKQNIDAVSQITKDVVVIAEETAAGAEEVAASSQELASGMESFLNKSKELSKVASELKEDTSHFKL